MPFFEWRTFWITLAYVQPFQTSTMEFFCEIIKNVWSKKKKPVKSVSAVQ